MDDPILSIIVPTYCHEKYIGQALDSILMQKTKYSYEVLVGEDASPDGTREILKQYEKKYPGKFNMFYRDANMCTLGKSNPTDLRHRAKGKYIITLEGDDYWIDENKLEKQVNFLEEHPDYIAVSHNCIVVDDKSKPTGESYPECKQNEYSVDHFFKGIMPGQTATIMTRNYITNHYFDYSILEKGLSPGDRLLYFVLATHGKIFCIQETMSAYRHVTIGGSSFTATYKYDFKKEEHWHYELLKYSYTLGEIKSIKIAESLYMAALIHGLHMKSILFKEYIGYSKNIKHIYSAFVLYLKRKKYIKYNHRHCLK